MREHDGGPAFPGVITPTGHMAEGMTLRDYFAGQAISGVLAGRYTQSEITAARSTGYVRIAETAYEIADAMLAARKSPEQENGQ